MAPRNYLMRVIALTSIVAGPGASRSEGEEFDISDGDRSWLAAGYVRPVGDATETAASMRHSKAEKAIRSTRPIRQERAL